MTATQARAATYIDPEIPLIDLHRHIDGSVRLTTILELAQKHQVKLLLICRLSMRSPPRQPVFRWHKFTVPKKMRWGSRFYRPLKKLSWRMRKP